MLTLEEDDEEILPERPIGVEAPPPRRPIDLRPLLIILGVVGVGGALGTGGYFLSNLGTRDVIGMLDVADKETPRLAMEMPGRPGAEDKPGGFLTPPGAVSPQPAAPGAASQPTESVHQPTGIAPMPQTPPFKPELAVPAPVAVAPAPTIVTVPTQPSPRNPDQPPSYAALPAARAGEAKPLATAPIEALVRLGAYGPLPVVGRDGRQAWQAYARPFDDIQDRPRLAVVVTGLGLDKDASEAAIAKLPPEVTLAFSPYAGGLDKWVKKARDAGHEVMLALPAEANGFPARDPGPWGLLSTAGAEENVSRLEKVLARATGYVGVWAAEGPFTASAQLAPVLAALKERGLLYVGEGAKEDPRPPALAPFATIEVDAFRDAIDARLAQAAVAAPQKGRVVIVAPVRPVTLDRLAAFLAKLPDQGVAVAPVSAVVRQGGKS